MNRRIFIWRLAASFAAIPLLGFAMRRRKPFERLRVDFSLPSADHTPSYLIQGRKNIEHFHAFSCPPCRAFFGDREVTSEAVECDTKAGWVRFVDIPQPAELDALDWDAWNKRIENRRDTIRFGKVEVILG